MTDKAETASSARADTLTVTEILDTTRECLNHYGATNERDLAMREKIFRLRDALLDTTARSSTKRREPHGVTFENWLTYQPFYEIGDNNRKVYTDTTVEAAWEAGRNAAPQENKAGAAPSDAGFKATDLSGRGLPNEPAAAALVASELEQANADLKETMQILGEALAPGGGVHIGDVPSMALEVVSRLSAKPATGKEFLDSLTPPALFALLSAAGYDTSITHHNCYKNFSYLKFTEIVADAYAKFRLVDRGTANG